MFLKVDNFDLLIYFARHGNNYGVRLMIANTNRGDVRYFARRYTALHFAREFAKLKGHYSTVKLLNEAINE